jgi:hypothetical protein
MFVYTIHIYAFLLYSEVVFQGSGTLILRSTDEYPALCGIKRDINCTLAYWIFSVVATEQAIEHITPLVLMAVHCG